MENCRKVCFVGLLRFARQKDQAISLVYCFSQNQTPKYQFKPWAISVMGDVLIYSSDPRDCEYILDTNFEVCFFGCFGFLFLFLNKKINIILIFNIEFRQRRRVS